MKFSQELRLSFWILWTGYIIMRGDEWMQWMLFGIAILCLVVGHFAGKEEAKEDEARAKLLKDIMAKQKIVIESQKNG